MTEHCRVAIAATVLIATACQKDQTDELRAKLKAPEVATRVTAASDLGKQRTASRPAVPDLIAALKDEAWQVRVAASVALGRVGDKESPARAVEPLIALTRDGNAWVRRYAVWALGMLRTGLAALLYTARLDADPLVREFASEAFIAATAGGLEPRMLEESLAEIDDLSKDATRLSAPSREALRRVLKKHKEAR